MSRPPVTEFLQKLTWPYLHEDTATEWAKMTAYLCNPAHCQTLDMQAVHYAASRTVAALLNETDSGTAGEAVQLIQTLIATLSNTSKVAAMLKAGLFQHSQIVSQETRPPA